MDNTHNIISDNVVTESITVEEYNFFFFFFFFFNC